MLCWESASAPDQFQLGRVHPKGDKNPREEQQPCFWKKVSGTALWWRFVPLTQAHFDVNRLSEHFLSSIMKLLSAVVALVSLCVVLQCRYIPLEKL